MDHLQPLQILLYAFPGIPDDEAEQLVRTGEVRSYPADTVLCQEGAIESTFYILMDGEVQVSKSIDQGEVRLLKRLGPGDFFGEMAILQDAPRAATVITTMPSTALEIRKESFDQLLRRSASMAMAMVREVTHRLRENDEMAIGDLRLKAREIALAYQKLAEQEYARRQFLTTIAHELRTPLTAAGGTVQVLLNNPVEGVALQSALGNVHRNLSQVVDLVNDLLFVQEMDLILPRFQELDFRALVEGVIAKCRPEAERNGIEFVTEFEPDLPWIEGDPRSLQRAVTALMDNAVKFSPGGGQVTLSLGQAEQELWLQVRDPGVGIPPEARERIFDRFFHLDQIGDHLFRGVGLGLSIAREVIEQHHGLIQIESSMGEGTLAVVRLPLRPAHPQAASA